MAPAYDTSVVGNGNGVNSFTLAALTTAQTNELIIVDVNASQTSSTVSSITATGLTFVNVQGTNVNGTSGRTEQWRAFATSVLSSVVITINFTGSFFPQCSAVGTAYTGANTSGTNGSGAIGAINLSTGGGGSLSVSLTTTANNSLVACGATQGNANAWTAGTGQTIRNSTTSAGSFSGTMSETQNSVTASSGTSVTSSATVTATSYAILQYEILAAANTFIARPNPFPLQAINRASTY